MVDTETEAWGHVGVRAIYPCRGSVSQSKYHLPEWDVKGLASTTQAPAVHPLCQGATPMCSTSQSRSREDSHFHKLLADSFRIEA